MAKNPDVLKVLIEELNRVDQWAVKNRDTFATELATIWGLPKPVADASVARQSFGTVPITKAILAEQQQIADTFLALKLIPKKINLLEAAAAGIA